VGMREAKLPSNIYDKFPETYYDCIVGANHIELAILFS
jgi:hypothetical protein